jgi:hypothetical protein
MRKFRLFPGHWMGPTYYAVQIRASNCGMSKYAYAYFLVGMLAHILILLPAPEWGVF